MDNQIRALDHIGLFKTPARRARPSRCPGSSNPYDEKADLNDRARTYLHVNCSICHVSDGGGNSYIELAYGNKLEDTKAVGGRPVQGTFGIADAMIIAPGEPERSVLYYRIASLGRRADAARRLAGRGREGARPDRRVDRADAAIPEDRPRRSPSARRPPR